MKNLKQDILDALHDATNLDNGRVSVPYFTELLDGILSEQCNIANVVQQSELLSCETCKFNCDDWDDNHPCANCAGFEFWEAT